MPTDAVTHPLDRQALAALRQVPGLDEVVRLVFEKGFERFWRLQNIGASVRVGPGHFGELHALYRGCVDRLGVSPEPPLYLRQGPLNAWTTGVQEPFIVLTTAMVNNTTPAELEFVIGHELGHIRCGHVLYNTLATQLRLITSLVPVAGRILSATLGVALMEWHRKAELSCDRFGMLAVQELDPALRLMVKFAGAPYAMYDRIDVDAFLAQYEAFERLDADGLTFLYRMAAESGMTHPWITERAYLLRAWCDEGGLEALLDGAPPEAGVPPPPPLRTCGCGAVIPTGDRFCGACGAATACPACGHASEPSDGFCDACGSSL